MCFWIKWTGIWIQLIYVNKCTQTHMCMYAWLYVYVCMYLWMHLQAYKLLSLFYIYYNNNDYHYHYYLHRHHHHIIIIIIIIIIVIIIVISIIIIIINWRFSFIIPPFWCPRVAQARDSHIVTVVFLNETFGNALLPKTIEGPDFDQAISAMELDTDRELFWKWYHWDENAQPPCYKLQPISTDIPNIKVRFS